MRWRSRLPFLLRRPRVLSWSLSDASPTSLDRRLKDVTWFVVSYCQGTTSSRLPFFTPDPDNMGRFYSELRSLCPRYRRLRFLALSCAVFTCAGTTLFLLVSVEFLLYFDDFLYGFFLKVALLRHTFPPTRRPSGDSTDVSQSLNVFYTNILSIRKFGTTSFLLLF